MKKLYLVTIFAIAFAYIEAAVVVYLRRIPVPTGPVATTIPIEIVAMKLPPDILATERAREIATIVILLSFSILCGRKWEKLGLFLWTFGFWDIFYYVFLHVLIRWPASLKTIDCLFLIPKPWIAPVYQPVVASIVMILIAGVILSLAKEKTKRSRS